MSFHGLTGESRRFTASDIVLDSRFSAQGGPAFGWRGNDKG